MEFMTMREIDEVPDDDGPDLPVTTGTCNELPILWMEGWIVRGGDSSSSASFSPPPGGGKEDAYPSGKSFVTSASTSSIGSPVTLSLDLFAFAAGAVDSVSDGTAITPVDRLTLTVLLSRLLPFPSSLCGSINGSVDVGEDERTNGGMV